MLLQLTTLSSLKEKKGGVVRTPIIRKADSRLLIASGARHTKFHRVLRMAFLLVLVGGALEVALAQPSSATEQADRTADRPGTIEEILVTARRREERLQDTPISVVAFTGDTLSTKGIDNVATLGYFVPNLTFDQGTGNTGGSSNAQVYIRGIGQQDYLFTSDPGVGIYIDEVYFPRSLGSMLDLVDLERVEVLRGPQGTLFGRNTIGGAIALVSTKPGQEFGGKATLTVGDFHRADTQVSVNIPLVADTLAMRVSASSLNRDGYVTRLADGIKLGDINSDGARVVLKWTPSENVSALLSADYTRKREQSLADVMIAANDAATYASLWNRLVGVPKYGIGCCQAFLTGNHRTTNATGKSQSDLNLWGVSANVEWRLPALVLKSITAYRTQSAAFSNDADHSPLEFIQMNDRNNEHFVSQEFQIRRDAPQDRLDWVLGAFYMREKGTENFRSLIGVGLYPVFPVLSGSLDRTRKMAIDNKSTAVFGQADLKFTQKVTATAGVRYTRDSKTFDAEVFNNGAGIYTVPPGTETADSWGAVSATAALQRKVFTDSMIYASGSRGFKSGGFNGKAKNVTEATSTFNPEYVWTYEVGYKGTLLDRRMTLNAAVFYSDYRDLQLFIVAPNFDILATNAGRSTMKGAEVDFNARIGDRLRLGGGVGYIDAKYTELSPQVSGLTLGTRMPKTPKWTGNVSVDYAVPVGHAGTVTIGADYTFKSSFFHVPSTLSIMKQDTYGLLSARLMFAAESGRWEVALLGTNLTDKEYTTNALESIGFIGTADATFGRPRELAARLLYRL
jgi:iron complex outermembrane receptor protein